MVIIVPSRSLFKKASARGPDDAVEEEDARPTLCSL